MNRSQRESLRDGYVEWLSRFEWQMFGSLTNRFQTSRLWMGKKVENFIRQLGPTACGVAGFERSLDGNFHAHVLLAGLEEVTVRRARQSWTHGFSKVTRFKPEGGASAAGYLSKALDIEAFGNFTSAQCAGGSLNA